MPGSTGSRPRAADPHNNPAARIVFVTVHGDPREWNGPGDGRARICAEARGGRRTECRPYAQRCGASVISVGTGARFSATNRAPSRASTSLIRTAHEVRMSVVSISARRRAPGETELEQFEELAVTLSGRLTRVPHRGHGSGNCRGRWPRSNRARSRQPVPAIRVHRVGRLAREHVPRAATGQAEAEPTVSLGRRPG